MLHSSAQGASRCLPSRTGHNIYSSGTARGAPVRAVGRAGHSVGAASVALPPVTKEDMFKYLASGCKPPERWRIGTEHEKFVYRKSDNRPAEYADIQYILNGLVSRFGWEPIMEKEYIIGAKANGESVTLEPGGQLELSGAPVSTLHDVSAELRRHLQQVKELGEERNVAYLAMGVQPKWSVADTPAMPKGRYNIMRQYMPKVGTMGLDMMFRTCTVQVNLDFESEADMVDKMRASLALQPVATALFANSPFLDGRPSGFKSFRSHVWTDVDKARTGDLPFVFQPGFGFERYVEYMLDVPMYFVYRDGTYVDVAGHSFRDYVKGKSAVLPGQRPSLEDFENHLTTAFPEVRLKRFLEQRGADCGSEAHIMALPALWVGLLYDKTSLAQACALVADWTEQERAHLRAEVPRLALQTPFRGKPLQAVAQEVVRIAKEGLVRRGLREEGHLTYLEEIAATGLTCADKLLLEYNGAWKGSVDGMWSGKYTH